MARPRGDGARLASTLLKAGIADTSDWVLSKRNPLDFVKKTMDRWLAIRHAETIREQFSLHVTLSTSLDHCWPNESAPESVAQTYLTIEPESAGYVVLGPALRLLDPVHPRLPATFAALFLAALNRWVRIYDYRDALERIEMLREWYDSDPEGGEVQLPDIERSIPQAIRKRPLGERTLHRLIPSLTGPLVRQLIEAALELDRLSKQGKRPDIGDDVQELLMDCGEPVPAMVAVFEGNDAIEGTFNEERHAMLEVPPEPNVLIPFNGADAVSISEAFSTLACLCETSPARAA
jgi:hypothetical protein